MKSLRSFACFAAAIVVLSTGSAFAESEKSYVDIDAQDIQSALLALGKQLGAQISVSPPIDDSVASPSVRGEFTLREALDRLLANSGLGYTFLSDGSVVVAMADTEDSEDGAAADADLDSSVEGGPLTLRNLVVTGSKLLTNPGQLDRQLTTYDRTEIDASGATNLEEFLRDIPQNFNAPTSNGAAFVGEFGGSRNFFGAAGVNLRGLSARATLVLIDGKRTARGGVLGEIVDINTIPLSMIERIEVIFDGASSLYGADAVGGVVNIITRKDYQGLNVAVTHSRPEQGGTSETIVTLGGSYSWDSGSVTTSYDYQKRDELTGDERDILFSTTSEIDFIPYGAPGNIVAVDEYDQTIGGFVTPPLFKLDANGNPVGRDDPTGVTSVFSTQLPAGSDGMLTLADFAGRMATAGSRAEAGRGLIPSRDDHSIRINARQELTADLLLSGSVTYTGGDTSSLEQNHEQQLFVGSNLVSWGNPHNPFGSNAWMRVELPFLPDVQRFTDKKSLSVDLALDGKIGENWEWTLFGLRSKLENDGQRFNVLGGFSDRALLNAGLNIFVDPLFGLSSEQEFIDMFVIPVASTINDSTEEQYDLVFKGTLFEAPGGSARAHFGLGSRTEESYLFDATGTVGVVGAHDAADISNRKYDQELARKTNSVTAEFNFPLVGSGNRKPGIAGLSATLSARFDDIESLGGRLDTTETDLQTYQTVTLSEGVPFVLEDSHTSWSAGLVWQPVDDWLSIRANLNESFTTPPMAAYVIPTDKNISGVYLQDEDGNYLPPAPFIYVSGGNPGLRPEFNRTRSIGFEIRPESIPDLFIAVNFHSNTLIDRLGEWQTPNLNTPADLTTDRIDLSIDEETGLLQQDNRVQNLGRVKVEGADLNVSYQFDTPIGLFNARLDYAYLHKSTWWQIDSCGENSMNCFDSSRDDPVERVGTVGFVVDDAGRRLNGPFLPIPRSRANFRIGWERGGWRLDVSKAYASTIVQETIRFNRRTQTRYEGSNTTKFANQVDVVVSYDFDKADSAPRYLRGTLLRLSVPNVFEDQAESILEPVFDTDTAGFFHPIASRPRGRTYTLTLEKRFEGV